MADGTKPGSVNIDQLTKPFPRDALMTRTVQGKGFTYVQGHSVINRLNAATGNCWDFEILDTQTREVEIAAKPEYNKPGRIDLLITARVRLTLPGLGSREHVGVQMVSPGSGEDLVKGAVTDALKKAASLFGVGIELYGEDFERDEHVDRATGEIRNPPPPPRSAAVDQELPVNARAEAAKTTWALAQSLGLSRDVLGKYAVEKIKKPLEECDTRELMKLCNALKGERDIPAMIDVLTNKPSGQSALMPPPEQVPLRNPDHDTN
jgi:hypothetical protein